MCVKWQENISQSELLTISANFGCKLTSKLKEEAGLAQELCLDSVKVTVAFRSIRQVP